MNDEENKSEKPLAAVIEQIDNSGNFRQAADVKVVESSVQRAFEVHRDFFVHSIAKRLNQIVAPSSTQTTVTLPQEGGWSEIESMSRLRSIVGGRFQNLKERWIQAGLPLREHRGDKEKDFKIDEHGWLELSSWIAKQGYEVRLRPDKPECLFEIKLK